MKTCQSVYHHGQWHPELTPMTTANLVFVFGDRGIIKQADIQAQLKEAFPKAHRIGCTTSGEINGMDIYDESVCVTAMEFESASVDVVRGNINESDSVEHLAARLAISLKHDNLRHVLVISDGQLINGTALVTGLEAVLPDGVPVTGGLAGDGTAFTETEVWHNEHIEPGLVVLIGFYGADLVMSHGSLGGWDAFGPERLITSSDGNVLHTLDNKPALELYKTYLGEHAEELPSSALLYPLKLQLPGDDNVVRTILNINEDNQSMTFAGDVPEGSYVQLMKANFERLIDGAQGAAEQALVDVANDNLGGVVLMISCVGRRLVLKQRTEEELEAVHEIFGDNWAYTGFYSYGEISPLVSSEYCALHNQTMTITTISELNA